MLFRKRRKPGAVATHAQRNSSEPGAEPESYTIEYDMLSKGAEVARRGRKVRQFAVVVGGNIRVVTSGDTVDRNTYNALVAAGAIKATFLAPPMSESNDTPAA